MGSASKKIRTRRMTRAGQNPVGSAPSIQIKQKHQFDIGEKVFVPDVDDLTHKYDWYKDGLGDLYNDQDSDYCINKQMQKLCGSWVEIADVLLFTPGFYLIRNDHGAEGWPLDFLHQQQKSVIPTANKSGHTCVEGSTVISNYFICKICGANMRKVK